MQTSLTSMPIPSGEFSPRRRSRRARRTRSLSRLDSPSPPVSPTKFRPKKLQLSRCRRVSMLFLAAIFVAVFSVFFSIFVTTTSSRKGKRFRSEQPFGQESKTLKAHFPIVMIPGISSSSLELWKSDPCVSNLFRAKIWGSATMIRQAVMDPACLLKHLSMNYTTGLDPQGIKVRSSLGLEGADYLLGGIYWVWAPIIEELAHIGYDPNNIFMAPYDWRLSGQLLEKRDRYFTKLKAMIELAYATSSRTKVVILAHSYGSLLYLYFMNWLQSPTGGNVNSYWIEMHIHSFINIAGPLLGVPKALPTVFSAEMRDTAELSAPLQYLKDRVWSRSMLVKLFRSWSSVTNMLPKGGNKIWGNSHYAADDLDVGTSSFGSILSFTHNTSDKDTEVESCATPTVDQSLAQAEPPIDPKLIRRAVQKRNLNIEESLTLLSDIAPGLMSRVDQATSFGFAQSNDFPNRHDPKYWSNPLESQLPMSSSMKIYCLYGVGKPTERAYSFQRHNGGSCSRIPFQIDSGSKNNGLMLCDGDGTVPLISLGFMCIRGWKSDRFNPGRAPVITREYPHKPLDLFVSGGDLRGGPSSGDHVDVLGNHDLIDDILLIVSNSKRLPENRIISDIEKFSERIDVGV